MAVEKSPFQSVIGRVLLRANIIRRRFQDVSQRPSRECNPETQHLRQYSVHFSKLADGPSPTQNANPAMANSIQASACKKAFQNDLVLAVMLLDGSAEKKEQH